MPPATIRPASSASLVLPAWNMSAGYRSSDISAVLSVRSLTPDRSPVIIKNMEDNEKYESIASDQEMPPIDRADQQESEGMRQELEKVQKAHDSLYDRLLRKQAEFDNYKKRVEREKSEFAQFASAELMKELLTALDSFDL